MSATLAARTERTLFGHDRRSFGVASTDGRASKFAVASPHSALGQRTKFAVASPHSALGQRTKFAADHRSVFDVSELKENA